MRYYCHGVFNSLYWPLIVKANKRIKIVREIIAHFKPVRWVDIVSLARASQIALNDVVLILQTFWHFIENLFFHTANHFCVW